MDSGLEPDGRNERMDGVTVNTERAQTIEGWMSIGELAWLGAVAEKAETVIEIGSHRGRSTRALGDNCRGVVYAVDRWNDPSDFRAFYGNMMDLIVAGRVRPVWSESLVASELFGLRCADMVFIDGDHDDGPCARDIEMYRPLLARGGGMLCGHDYGLPDHAGVKLAVDRVVGFVNVFETIWWTQL